MDQNPTLHFGVDSPSRFPQQSRFTAANFRATTMSSHKVGSFHQGQAMAHPTLQQQSQFQHQLQQLHQSEFQQQHHHQLGQQHRYQYSAQCWPRHQNLSPNYESTANAQAGRVPNNPTFTQESSYLVNNHAAAQNNGYSMSPYAASGMEVPYSNGDDIYQNSAAQGFPAKGLMHYGGEGPWQSPLPELTGGRAISDLGQDTDHSPSPKSYTSEMVPQPPTPESAVEAKSEINEWSFDYHYNSSPYALKAESSPNSNFSAQPRRGLGLTIAPTTPGGADDQFHGLPTPRDDSSLYGSEYSQESSPGITPGYPVGRRQYQSMTSRPRVPQTSSPAFNGLPNAYQARNIGTTGQEMALHRGAQGGVPAQAQHESRFQVPRTMDAQALRKLDDDILLRGKQEGLTYKQILEKLSVKAAESTLRGRYRSLTKPRLARVRKPNWSPEDIKLLKECVQQELNRINTHGHQSLTYNQKLGKVQWKKVADYIYKFGSYQFGNATCKRKWVEVNSGP